VEAKLLGFDVFSAAESELQENNLKLAKRGSKLIFNKEVSTRTTILIGPIPLTLEVGALATGRIDYTYALAGLKADADLTPTVLATAFASVGIDLLVVGAKVQANLTIIAESLDMAGHLNVNVPRNGLPTLDTKASVYNTLSTLDGNLQVIAWIMVPRFGWVPFKKKEFEYELFDWDGLKTEGALFSYEDAFDLYQ
jgi:hypothetical protein